jgi:hypothetical protein
MKNQGRVTLVATMAVLLATPVFSQSGDNQGQGQVVVTVLPKHEGEVPPSGANQDLSVKVNGKNAKVTKWTPYQSPANSIELVLLIDGAARSSLGRQMEDMANFINTLPPNTKAAIAYMQNGRATFAAPLSADHSQVLRELHLPGGFQGSDASPYFCLSDLAKNWPSNSPEARREVVMVTDGVDNYENPRQFDPDDTYVQAAINDSVRARLVVYSIYWKNQGLGDQSLSQNSNGQNLLLEVTQATGGKSFWEGMGNPVSFEPYFDELTRRLRNQYELGFVSPLNGKPEVESMKLKLSASGTDVAAPDRVYIVPAAPAHN